MLRNAPLIPSRLLAGVRTELYRRDGRTAVESETIDAATTNRMATEDTLAGAAWSAGLEIAGSEFGWGERGGQDARRIGDGVQEAAR